MKSYVRPMGGEINHILMQNKWNKMKNLSNYLMNSCKLQLRSKSSYAKIVAWFKYNIIRLRSENNINISSLMAENRSRNFKNL